mgnify:CR=1 FL=1
MAETGDRRAGTIFRHIRIAELVSVLGVGLIYAWNDVRRRKARTEGQSPAPVSYSILHAHATVLSPLCRTLVTKQQ